MTMPGVVLVYVETDNWILCSVDFSNHNSVHAFAFPSHLDYYGECDVQERSAMTESHNPCRFYNKTDSGSD